MSKVNLKVVVNNSKNEFMGIFNEKSNIITYSDMDNTLNKFFLDENLLIRSNTNYNLKIDFNKCTITYNLVGEISFNIPIKILSIFSEKNVFKVFYVVSDNDFFKYELYISEI